jgi:hypothetical protein
MSSAQDGYELETVQAHGGVGPGGQVGPVGRAGRVPARLAAGEALGTVRLRTGIRDTNDGGVTDFLQLVGRLRRCLGCDNNAGRVIIGRVDGERLVGDHFAVILLDGRWSGQG